MNISKLKLNRIINESIKKILKEDYDEQISIYENMPMEEFLNLVDVEAVAEYVVNEIGDDYYHLDAETERGSMYLEYENKEDNIFVYGELEFSCPSSWNNGDWDVGIPSGYEIDAVYLNNITDLSVSTSGEEVFYEIPRDNPFYNKLWDAISNRLENW